MNPSAILDIVLVAIALSAMWSGWKQGIASSLLSFVGVIAGGIVGYFLAPPAMNLVEQPVLRQFVGVATIVILIVIVIIRLRAGCQLLSQFVTLFDHSIQS